MDKLMDERKDMVRSCQSLLVTLKELRGWRDSCKRRIKEIDELIDNAD